MLATSAFGYETSTHEVLSSVALGQSVIARPGLLEDLGLAAYGLNQLQNMEDIRLQNQTVEDLIRFGAVFEDTDAPPIRPYNHFFDPQYQSFQGRGLDTVLAKGHPSPDWALEDRGNIVSISSPPFSTRLVSQQYSLRHGYEYLHKGLIAASRVEREAAFSSMFQILGQVMHHVQDMGQPEHTRNDPHLSNTPESFFERYTKSGRYEGGAKDEEDFLPRDLVRWGTYPVPLAGNPSLLTARSFWHSPNAGIAQFKGMAEYSANNFVTRDTNFGADINQGYLSAHPDFPLPDGGSAYIGPRELVAVEYSDGTSQSRYMTLVKGAIWDGYLNQLHSDVPLASLSVLYRWLPETISSRQGLLTINRYVYEQQYPLLLPRAVAFSAGLINHFFRGRVALQRNPSNPGLWDLLNQGREVMSGFFSVYYETSDGRRYPLAGNSSWYSTLEAGARFQVAFQEPPASARKIVVAFEGQVGSEFATTGHVSQYSPPPVACGEKISASGGIEGYDEYISLGSMPGEMEVGFEAFHIPDKIEVIAKGSGQKLAGSSDYVSGYHKYRFNYDPQLLGTQEVRLKIIGSETDTRWEVNMGCPGDPIEDPRIDVALRFFNPDSFSIKSCSGKLYIDGQYRSSLNSGTRNIKLTPGLHEFEYRNKDCDPSTFNSYNNYSAQYTDPTGTYPLGSGHVPGANWGIFTIRAGF